MSGEGHNSIHDRVLKSIEEGRIKQRPRSYFLLRGVALALGAVLLGLITLFLISFAIFTLRQKGGWFAPAFGGRGWLEFIFDLPWLIVLSAIALLLLLEVMVRRYQYAYERPLVISLLGLAIAVGLGSVIVERLHIHDHLWQKARLRRLPLAGPLYMHAKPGGCREVTAGVILQNTPYGFNLENGEDEIYVVVTPQTIVADDINLKRGSAVAVLGRCAGATTTASQIKSIPLNFRPHRRMIMP